MSLPRLATKRPVTTLMCALAMVFLGIMALNKIPVDLLPEITFPVMAVTTQYSGAAPEEIEALVTRPLEEVVGLVANVRRISSESTEGSSVIVAEFNWGTNMDAAANDVRDALELVKRQLPPDAGQPQVFKADPSMLPLMQLVLFGEHDPQDLTWAAERLRDRLERVEGVAAVRIAGGVQEEVVVEADPLALQARGLTFAHLVGALRSTNTSLPAGLIDHGQARQAVRVSGAYGSLADIEATLVMTHWGPVTVGEVASVSKQQLLPATVTRVNGVPGVSLLVQRQSGGNTVLVARRLRGQLKSALAELPPGIQVQVAMDQSEFVTSAIQNVARNAATGAVLAALTLFFFLRDLPTVLTIATAIPVSVVATFTVMYFAGLTLNLMSLGGLALGTGMLVDNAIVVLENIFRHRSLGLPSSAAAVSGAEEVSGPILASTLTTLVVFVPVLFIPGLASQLFRDLALTVSIALVASLVVSVTMVPVAAGFLLGRTTARGVEVGSFSPYQRWLESAPSRRNLALLVVVGGLATGGGLFYLVESEFLPVIDRKELNIDLRLPAGSLLEHTDAYLQAMEEVVLQRPGTGLVLATAGTTAAGFDLAGTGGSTHLGRIFVRLHGGAGTHQAIDNLERTFAQTGLDVSVTAAPGIAGQERAFGSPIEVAVHGPDLLTLARLAETVVGHLSTVAGLHRVTSSLELASPEARLVVFQPGAGAHLLSTVYIASVVRTALHGEIATRYQDGERNLDVRVVSGAGRQELGALMTLPVLSPSGHSAFLGDVAVLEEGTGPSAILRRGHGRVAVVQGQLKGRKLGPVTADVRRALAGLDLPPGYEVTIGGESRELAEAFSSLWTALGIAAVLIYLALSSHFESLTQPLVIMVSVPLAFAGALLALLVTGHALSVPSLIGVVALSGIVVNNGIVLMDYINGQRRAGISAVLAVQAASSVRLRPILMTTTTTVLGLLPLAMGLGSGAELQAPLAVAMVGGLLLATALTLLVVPPLYLLLDRPERVRES
ncbi:MAG: efflux RND transporter permease subunit [Bacillota bacterium]